MAKIRIQWPQGELQAELRDTPTAQSLLAALPLQSKASTWGDEVYFSVPFAAEREADASEVVPKGAVCYWLDGSSVALLFGPTPVSVGDECRLISTANIVGQIEGDCTLLKSVRSGDQIQLEQAPE